MYAIARYFTQDERRRAASLLRTTSPYCPLGACIRVTNIDIDNRQLDPWLQVDKLGLCTPDPELIARWLLAAGRITQGETRTAEQRARRFTNRYDRGMIDNVDVALGVGDG